MCEGTVIEKRFYKVADIPFGVEGQVDLAHVAEDGRVTIVDWKSGGDSGEGDNSLQLGVYALWARESHACDVDKLALYKAFLGSGDLVRFPVTGQTLASVRLRILQDSECFARMHDYGCAGVLEAFAPCAQSDVCRGCPFLTVCPEGREALGW